MRLVSCSARVVQLEWQHRRVDDSASARQLQFVIEYNTSFDPHTWHVSHVCVSVSRAVRMFDVADLWRNIVDGVADGAARTGSWVQGVVVDVSVTSWRQT